MKIILLRRRIFHAEVLRLYEELYSNNKVMIVGIEQETAVFKHTKITTSTVNMRLQRTTLIGMSMSEIDLQSLSHLTAISAVRWILTLINFFL